MSFLGWLEARSGLTDASCVAKSARYFALKVFCPKVIERNAWFGPSRMAVTGPHSVASSSGDSW